MKHYPDWAHVKRAWRDTIQLPLGNAILERVEHMDIVWQEPPEEALIRARGGNGRYVDVAIALRSQPERWAILPAEGERTPKGAQNAAQNIRRGVTKGFDKGEFEAVADGTIVYVRYLPPDSRRDVDEDTGEDAHGRRDGAAIRAWAKDNGFQVADRGALPQNVVEAYQAAMGEPEG